MNQSTNGSRPSGPIIITILVIVLLVLHQDNWFWTDDRLIFGVMPIGLFWHACISIGAALMWYLATRIAWPIDDMASQAHGKADADVGEGRN